MKTISALQEKVVTTGLSLSCCMGNVGGTVHPQLLGGEVLSSSVCIYEDVVRYSYHIHKPEKNILVLF